MTPAGLLQSQLIPVDLLSLQPHQESLPLGCEMWVATGTLPGKKFEYFLVPRAYPPLVLNSKATRTCKKFGIVFPGRSITLLAPRTSIQKIFE